MASRRTGILHVVHSLNVGGAEKLVYDLTRRTDAARFAVCVACLDDAAYLLAQLAETHQTACSTIAAELRSHSAT